jgi:HAD superfamily hydrolase (TIGR01484 family)
LQLRREFFGLIDLKLFASDLDRTLFPNGPESPRPGALSDFAIWRRSLDVPVAFVSGRTLNEVEEGCMEYDIPLPDIVAADVGTRLFERKGQAWEEFSDYSQWIQGEEHVIWDPTVIRSILVPIEGLCLQEDFRQNALKISYYVEPMDQTKGLAQEVDSRLKAAGLAHTLVYSLDEPRDLGLVDVISPGADKHGALSYIRARLGIEWENIVYAGDSGNDLSALKSGCNAIAVRNMDADLRNHLRKYFAARASEALFYEARGEQGESGYYTSGVIEALKAWNLFPRS